MCNCNKSGTTDIDFLTLVPGGAADNATYLLNLTHHTCGGRRLCANGLYPVSARLEYTPLNAPHSVGNGTYCCDVLCTGTCTYMPYRQNNGAACQCSQCPVTDNIYFTMCVPCASPETPVLTGGLVVATPTDITDCCPFTDAVAIATSINVATAAATTAGQS